MISFNQTSVATEQVGTGLFRQVLLKDQRVNDATIRLARFKLEPGAGMRLNNSPKTLSWFQVLEGGMAFQAYYTDSMTDAHSAFLPPGFNATLSSDHGVSLLYAEIPDISRIHAGSLDSRPVFIVTEWEREPVLESEHDARKRVRLVAADICETAVMQVEMAVYPSGTASPECYNDGADTFMYFLTGRGTAQANGQEYSINQGDLVYFSNREQYSLKATNDSEMRFLEFYVPAEFKTVETDSRKTSAWRSTHRDIHGRETLLDQKAHIATLLADPWAE